VLGSVEFNDLTPCEGVSKLTISPQWRKDAKKITLNISSLRLNDPGVKIKKNL